MIDGQNLDCLKITLSRDNSSQEHWLKHLKGELVGSLGHKNNNYFDKCIAMTLVDVTESLHSFGVADGFAPGWCR